TRVGTRRSGSLLPDVTAEVGEVNCTAMDVSYVAHALSVQRRVSLGGSRPPVFLKATTCPRDVSGETRHGKRRECLGDIRVIEFAPSSPHAASIAPPGVATIAGNAPDDDTCVPSLAPGSIASIPAVVDHIAYQPCRFAANATSCPIPTRRSGFPCSTR